MIKYLSKETDLFTLDAQAIVNPVNTFGISGAGLALAFKIKYPKNYASYASACKNKTLVIGSLVTSLSDDGQVIINLPTKENPRMNSKIEFVEAGVKALAQFCQQNDIASVGVPALGCGLGRLEWDSPNGLHGSVKDIYDKYLQSHNTIFLCIEPK